ncbi:MAG: hypothetical protein U1E65_12145 [Myxococcota bacterium]
MNGIKRWAVALGALLTPAAAWAQNQVLSADDGSMETMWSLTAPNAGPGDWVGVAYSPPIEFPFRVVSASMFYLDTACCVGNSCTDAQCGGNFVDWDRFVIARDNLSVDPAGLTPDITSPVALDTSIRCPAAGASAPAAPFTLTPYVWTLPAGTIFDAPGRIFVAIKYLNNDQYMRFAVDDSSPNLGNSIHTSDNFATRSSIWAFGNVGMHVTIAPILNFKIAPNPPASRFVLASDPGLTMLSVRVGGGPSAATITRVRVTASGTGDDAADVSAVRLVLDANGDGVEGPGDTTLASGRFAANDGTLDLNLSRTLGVGAAERWLVVYDLAGSASGGETFRASVAASTDVSSSIGNPYFSGAIVGAPVTVAGRLRLDRGASTMPSRVVQAGQTGLATLQIHFFAENEGMSLTGLALTADGSLDDTTGLTQVRLYVDADSSGTLTGPDVLLASGGFPQNDGRRAYTFPARAIAAGASLDLIAVYDLAASAPGGATLRTIVALPTDVTASGVFSGPVPTSGPRALAGVPIVGSLATIGGALTAAIGPASPAAGTAQPGTTHVPMLQLVLSASAEPVILTTLRVNASGTGDEVLDIDRVELWRDANQNGLVDAGDVRIGNPQVYFQNDGSLSFSFPGETIPAGASRALLLSYDFTSAPTGGQTYALSLTDATALSATGQISLAPVPPSGAFPLVSSTKTVLGGFSLALAAENPAPTRAQPGTTDVPVLVLSASSQGERFDVSDLSFHGAGSLDDSTVVRVALWRDQGVVGRRDAPDVLLGTASFSADDGVAHLHFAAPISLSAGANERWLLTYDLGAGAPGETFRASLSGPGDVVVSGSLSGSAAARGLPLSSSTHAIGGSLILSLAPTSPAGAVAQPGQTGVPAIVLRLGTNLEPITVSGLVLSTSGAGNDATGVQSARLYADQNRSGAFEAASDVLLATGAPQANDGPLSFVWAGRTIGAGASEDWLVVYDLAPGVQAGDTFALGLNLGSDVSARAPSGPLFGATGAPIAGAPLAVLGALTVARGAADPSARSVARGSTDVPVLAFDTIALGETFSAGRFTVRARGTADDVNDIAGVSLWLDADRSGTVGPGDTRLDGPLRFAGDDGSLDLSPRAALVAPGAAVSFLFTADLAPAAQSGRTFRLDLRDPTDVGATGFGGRPVGASAGVPLSANLITVGGSLRVARGSAPPQPAIVLRGETGVVALSLSFAADTETATLTQLTLHGSGSGDDALGLSAVRLVSDDNRNGRADAAERVLATGRFPADDGALSLSLNEPIPLGAPLEILAIFDVGASPLGAETFRLSVDPTVDVGISSASGAVRPTGPAILGPVDTVGGGFRVEAAASPALGMSVGQSATDLGVFAATLVADNEICTVDAITIRAAGSIDDAQALTRVRLAVDVDQNGIFDFMDQLLGTEGHYSADDGSIRFGGLARVIGRNARETWLVVYDLSGTAHDQQTFSARIGSSDDLEVRCDVSGAVRASGAPIEGQRFTVEEAGALAASAGDAMPPAAFLSKGAVRAPALSLRLRAEVHDLVLDRLVLSSTAASGTILGVELFVDENRDGRVDRGDRPIGVLTAPDGSGRFTLDALALPITTAEPVYVLATVNLALSATPGTNLGLRVAQNADLLAHSAAGPVPAHGAPIAGNTMTVAGDLTIVNASTATRGVAKNDDAGIVVLDLRIAAMEEHFTVEAVTLTAEGTLVPSSGITALSLVLDQNDDGRADPSDPVLARGITFPEGSRRARAEGLSLGLDPGQPQRWLVVADLAGTAHTEQTLTVSIASSLDVRARGDRVGAAAPVGGPIVGPSFIIAPSLYVLPPATPLADALVKGDARDVVALAFALGAANEDVTVSRISVSASGSLDDRADLRGARLLLDQNGDGRLDAGDVELMNGVHATADDGVFSFSPLAEHLQKNQSTHYLVVLDLAGTGGAGKTLRLGIVRDADLSGLGSLSGAVAATGAPVLGPTLTLVGALNLARAAASPAGVGVEPKQTFPALELEVFTVGEAVDLSAIALSLSGSANDPAAVTSATLWIDEDGDGAVGPSDRSIATASPDGDDGKLSFAGLGLHLDPSSSTLLLATLSLSEGAAPGGTLRLGVAAPEDVRATGATSGALMAVGTPIQGSAFTIVSPFTPGPGGMTAGGCGCSTAAGQNGALDVGLGGVVFGLFGLRLFPRRSRKRRETPAS